MINVTDQMIFHLNNLNRENERITYQQTSGNVLQHGSDDTNIFSQGLYLEDKHRIYLGIEEQLTHIKAINETTDSTLATMKLSLDVIKNDMLKALNAGMAQSDKLAIATAFEGIKENLFTWGNTEINNEYIFAGSNSTIKPFEMDENGKVTYVGDNVLKQTPVDEGSYRDRGTTGFDAFMYTSSSAILGQAVEFTASESVVDQSGNTWAFPESSGVGERLDFFDTDTITDNNGTTWTLNKLTSTLEADANADGTPDSFISIEKVAGGYQFKDELSSTFLDGAGNSVTSFQTATTTTLPPQLELRQYDQYGNLTGTTLPVTEIDNGDGIVDGGDDEGLFEPKYRTDNITDPSLILEAKHSFFDDLDILISALKGVDPNDGITPLSETEQNDIIRGMLDKVGDAADALSIAHSEVGSRNKIFIDATFSVSAQVNNFDVLFIENNKIDLTKVTLEAKHLEITYSALYSSINRLYELNLVNFLR